MQQLVAKLHPWMEVFISLGSSLTLITDLYPMPNKEHFLQSSFLFLRIQDRLEGRFFHEFSTLVDHPTPVNLWRNFNLTFALETPTKVPLNLPFNLSSFFIPSPDFGCQISEN
jgi:hypothetical protein